MKHPRYSILRAAFLMAAIVLAPFDLRATDLTTARATSEQSAVYVDVPMNASTTIYVGTMVCVDTDGYARNASLDTTGYHIIGVAQTTKTNSGADGAASIRVKRGLFKFDNSTTNAVDQDDVGQVVYVEDNHTVADSTTYAVQAGICVAKVSDGVWVDNRPLALSTGTVSNDSVTSAKIAADTIVAADIATGAVDTAEILDGAIVAADIATGAVDTAEILDGAIVAADLASNAVTTAKIADGNVTPAKTNIVEARTATSDGLTTAIISDTTTHVTVTSASANDIIVLPTPTPGRMVVIDVASNGFELRSSTPASVAINGGTGSGAESAIAANSTVLAICISATKWKAIYLDADSDVAKVEAAAP